MSRFIRVLIVVALLMGLAAPASAARPETKLGGLLGTMWQRILETPISENPFGGGDPCLNLSEGGKRIVAPIVPIGATTPTCTVKPGTKLFITAWSSECSNAEPSPFFGRNEAELRECAEVADQKLTVHELTVDGKPVTVTEVISTLLKVDLPADNIFGVTPGPALSVAHGWVALLHPLPPGTHKLNLRLQGADAFGNPVDFTNTTTIIVRPR